MLVDVFPRSEQMGRGHAFKNINWKQSNLEAIPPMVSNSANAYISEILLPKGLGARARKPPQTRVPYVVQQTYRYASSVLCVDNQVCLPTIASKNRQPKIPETIFKAALWGLIGFAWICWDCLGLLGLPVFVGLAWVCWACLGLLGLPVFAGIA